MTSCSAGTVLLALIGLCMLAVLPADAQVRGREASEQRLGASGPALLPVSPDAPEWASGTWTGTFACRRRTYTVTMMVPVEGQGQPVVLDYRWSGTGRETGSAQGRVLLEVSRGTGKRYDAIPADGAEADHPFRQVRVIPDPQGNPTFVSAPCRGPLALSRDPRTAPVRSRTQVGAVPEARPQAGGSAQPSQAARPSRDGTSPALFGNWQGELSCARSPSRPIEVTFGSARDIAGPATRRDRDAEAFLSADRPGRVAAEVVSYSMRGTLGSALSTRFIGEMEPDGRTLRFASVGGRFQLGEMRLRELRIDTQELDGSALRLELTIADMNCQAVALRRPDPLANPNRPAVPPPADGGAFYRARDDSSRCTALAEWGRRIEADLKTQTTQYRPVDPGVLFADPEFVPVFGRPYDLTGDTTFYGDVSSALRACQRDPLMRPRVQPVERLVLSLRDGRYVSHRVRQSRAALNTLNAAQAAMAANPDPATGVVHLAKAVEEFRKADIALFPSRRDEIVGRAEQGLSAKASQILDGEINRQRGRAPLDVIMFVGETRPLSSPVTGPIKGADRERAMARLLELERNAATAFMGAQLAAVSASPATLDGVRQIDALPAPSALKALSASVHAEHEPRWSAARRAKMVAAVGIELERALVMPAGRQGLQQGAAWYEAFSRTWKGYLDEGPVKEGLKRFFEDRKARLLAAANEYKAAVADRPPAERLDAMADFLLLPQDRRSPAALEYELIAFGL